MFATDLTNKMYFQCKCRAIFAGFAVILFKLTLKDAVLSKSNLSLTSVLMYE